MGRRRTLVLVVAPLLTPLLRPVLAPDRRGHGRGGHGGSDSERELHSDDDWFFRVIEGWNDCWLIGLLDWLCDDGKEKDRLRTTMLSYIQLSSRTVHTRCVY